MADRTLEMTATSALDAGAKPMIGTKFHVGVWIDEESAAGAVLMTAGHVFPAMRRVEIEHGVRLGHYRHDVSYDPTRAASLVVSQATVIGYA